MKAKSSSAALALLAICGLALVGHAEEEPEDNVKIFMRAKLEHSQKVLEGLTIENFDLIRKHAGQMEVLSQEAAWQVLQTPEYRQQSLEFRRSAHALRDAAEKKNLDAAALAYVDVTMKCVKCHQYVRQVRSASVDDLREVILPVAAHASEEAGR